MRRPQPPVDGEITAASLLMIDQLISGLSGLTDTQIAQLAASAVAMITLAVYYRAPAWLFGPDAKFWNPLRRVIVPLLDRIAKTHGDELGLPDDLDYAAYELAQSEFAAQVEAGVDDVGEALAESGYTRMPLAALKSLPDGRIERASWARRDGLLASTQTHVMIFEAPPASTGVEIYAHTEPNALNPLRAWAHYRGRGYDPEAGGDIVREWLDEETEFDHTTTLPDE
jgi:hypothetical protein